MLTRRHPWRAVVLIAVVLSVTGCSRFKLLYGFAGQAVSREVDFYLDITDDEAVGNRIDEFFVWHDTVMLPRYARILSAQADILDQGNPDRDEVAAAVTRMRNTADALVAGAAPFMAKVLVNHTAPEKLRFLEARMAERLAEHRAELTAPLTERIQDRIESIVENFERFTGDLTEVQRAFVRRYVEDSSGDMEIWLRNRAGRQRAFADFLAQRPNEAGISAYIVQAISRAQEISDPAFNSAADAWWAKFQTLLADVMVSLSADQRKTMRKNLRGYAADMIDLSS